MSSLRFDFNSGTPRVATRKYVQLRAFLRMHLSKIPSDQHRLVGVPMLPKLRKEFIMLKSVQWFMQKLSERLVATVASWMTSTVETMQALDEADQGTFL